MSQCLVNVDHEALKRLPNKTEVKSKLARWRMGYRSLTCRLYKEQDSSNKLWKKREHYKPLKPTEQTYTNRFRNLQMPVERRRTNTKLINSRKTTKTVQKIENVKAEPERAI